MKKKFPEEDVEGKAEDRGHTGLGNEEEVGEEEEEGEVNEFNDDELLLCLQLEVQKGTCGNTSSEQEGGTSKGALDEGRIAPGTSDSNSVEKALQQ